MNRRRYIYIVMAVLGFILAVANAYQGKSTAAVMSSGGTILMIWGYKLYGRR